MRILFFIAALFVCTCIHAQPGFGPEVGIGMSTMRFSPDTRFSSASHSAIFSGKIGGVADFSFTKRIYFQAGISISRKGQHREFSFYTADSLNAAVDQTLTLYYADVPVILLYKTGMQGKGRVIFGAGAVPGYIIGGRNKQQTKGVYNDTAFNNSSNTSVLPNSPVSKFDIGVIFTAGYELPTGLFFRAYYTSGVRDIGLGTEIDKNRMFGISAGYLFGKGRNINKETTDLIDKGTD